MSAVVSCPECGSSNVFYRAEKGEYECLSCRHKWPKGERKPIYQETVKVMYRGVEVEVPVTEEMKRIKGEVEAEEVSTESVILTLRDARKSIEKAEEEVAFFHFSEAHSAISGAHELLRTAARLLGFRPKEES